MRGSLKVALFACVGVVVACAHASVLDETIIPTDGGKTDKDGSNPNFDSGNPNLDSGNPSPDTSTSNCTTSPPSNVCGVDPQCGCNSDTCDVDLMKLDGTSACVTAGSTGVGKACTATANQCATGLTCIWGVCRPYCGSIGDKGKCTQPGTGICRQLNNNSSQPVANLLVCSTNCVLNDANSCGGKSGCIFDNANSVTDCYPVGSSMTCSKNQPNCAPGYECITTNMTTDTCAKWCKLGGNDCGAQVCGGFMPKVLVNNVEFGVCQ